MSFSLDGRVALVTGSSRGIGFALARALGEAGAVVVMNGRDAASLHAAADSFRGLGIVAHERAFDVCDEEAVARAVASIEADVGPIDILVNNAGIQRRAPFLDFALNDFRELIDVNLVSAFIVGKAVGLGMAARGHGKIINICSIQSELGRPTIAPYTATKGGLKMLTRGMCADLGPLGIQVNAIAPGYFATDLTAALVADDEFSAWVTRRTPAGRWGRVDELGGAAVFLASNASSFVNGQILYVDGGMTAVV
jgi:gluconate 5-dehydrogenase